MCEENDRVQLHSSPKLPHLVLLKINVMRNRSPVYTKLLWNVCVFRREIRRETVSHSNIVLSIFQLHPCPQTLECHGQ